MQLRLGTVLMGVFVITSISLTFAQETSSPPITELDAVSVTATRNSTAIGNVPGTVSVIKAEEQERIGTKDIRDIIRYEPGVSVSNNPTRSGLGSFTIRGIGGNRVLYTIDGARLPDFPANGQPGTYTRDTVDPEILKQVEIVRGPGSSLYGSDAIGGIVAYRTKDPADFLELVGKNWYTGSKFLYDSANDSFNETVTAAARFGKLEVLGLYTRRDGEEFEVENANPNPQEFNSNNGLLKFVAHPTETDKISLTGEYLEREVFTDIRTNLGQVPLSPVPILVTESTGNDETRRYRVGFEHQHNDAIAFIDRFSWRFGYQEAYREEDTEEYRVRSGGNRLRETERQFEQDVLSADLQLNSHFAPFGITNDFTYGVDYSLSHTRRYSERTELNLRTGTVLTTVGGEVFPNRTFPISDTSLLGGYLQDRIELFGGRLEITPGLRIDYYNLDPQPDDYFRANNPAEVADIDEVAFSPKAGVNFKIDDRFSLFGNYAHGFRAPPYDDANIGFNNLTSFYRVLPNTELRPETTDGFETGLRGKFQDGSSFSINGFYNLYKDFIQTTNLGVGPDGFTNFQSSNLDNVTIYGIELKGELRLPENFSLFGNLAYARGENEKTGSAIDSVDPLKIVTGLRYQHPDNWGGEIFVTWVDEKDRVSDPTYFKPSSYETVDLGFFYNWKNHITLNAGIHNLLDEHYFLAQDVVAIQENDRLLPLYAQPGRTFFISATLRW